MIIVSGSGAYDTSKAIGYGFDKETGTTFQLLYPTEKGLNSVEVVRYKDKKAAYDAWVGFVSALARRCTIYEFQE